METIDEEITAGALDFIERNAKAGTPFFCWWNSTRMHVFTHLKQESDGKTGLGIYPDGMVEHDGHVGQLLAKLHELGIADDTIVMWSTDNGAEELSWPDGGATPFRGEKDTNWEGGWRVPCAIRWPGRHQTRHSLHEIFAHEDMLPTLLAAAGEPDIVEKVKKGHQAGAKTFKVHLDGYNLLTFFRAEVKESPRSEFLYWSDEGDLMAIRHGDWKVHFVEQRGEGFLAWQEPFVPLRLPKLFNLRSDPFENAISPLKCTTRSGEEIASSCCCRRERWSSDGSRHWSSSRQDNGPTIGVSETCSTSSSKKERRLRMRMVQGRGNPSLPSDCTSLARDWKTMDEVPL
jgi:arylsulfatase A-like enzyme